MKLQAQLLAREVLPNADGTFDVKGAGLDQFQATSFPSFNVAHLLTRLLLEPEDIRPVQIFRLRITQGDREVMEWTNVPIIARNRDAAGRAYINLTMRLMWPTFGTGEGLIESAIDELQLPLLPFQVAHTPGGT
jgi:hypothetical protein